MQTQWEKGRQEGGCCGETGQLATQTAAGGVQSSDDWVRGVATSVGFGYRVELKITAEENGEKL